MQSAAAMTASRQTERTLLPDNPRDKKTKFKQRELTVATNNVRTLNGSGKEHRLLTGCEQFNESILAIQEHRQPSNPILPKNGLKTKSESKFSPQPQKCLTAQQ